MALRYHTAESLTSKTVVRSAMHQSVGGQDLALDCRIDSLLLMNAVLQTMHQTCLDDSFKWPMGRIGMSRNRIAASMCLHHWSLTQRMKG